MKHLSEVIPLNNFKRHDVDVDLFHWFTIGFGIRRNVVLSLFLSLFVLSMGCSSDDEVRLPTAEVSGNLTVNGKPEAGVVLQLIPLAEDELSKTTLKPGARTDANGDYSFMTHQVGDGVPSGKFKLVMLWPPKDDGMPDLENLPRKRPKERNGPPDRFQWEFFDPSKSEYEVVVDGQKQTLEQIDLKWDPN
ncbi:MAG: hypothetical protein AAF939_20640 [Planctomycetota bacterium]